MLAYYLIEGFIVIYSVDNVLPVVAFSSTHDSVEFPGGIRSPTRGIFVVVRADMSVEGVLILWGLL